MKDLKDEVKILGRRSFLVPQVRGGAKLQATQNLRYTFRV